jgi:hypothetical protein
MLEANRDLSLKGYICGNLGSAISRQRHKELRYFPKLYFKNAKYYPKHL